VKSVPDASINVPLELLIATGGEKETVFSPKPGSLVTFSGCRKTIQKERGETIYPENLVAQWTPSGVISTCWGTCKGQGKTFLGERLGKVSGEGLFLIE